MANLDTSICTRYVINRFSFSVAVPGAFNVTHEKNTSAG